MHDTLIAAVVHEMGVVACASHAQLHCFRACACNVQLATLSGD